MKKKDNISTYIKKELDNRELNPSHDAWNRMQARMDVVPVQEKSNYKWWLSAAVFVIFTLSTTIYLSTKNEKVSQDVFVINEHEKDTATQKVNNIQYTEDNILATNENNKTQDNSNQINQKENIESKSEVVKAKETKDSVANNKNELKTILEQKKHLVAANKLDSIKKLKKETNYADPDMLLYSIENKENIKESEKSRVVSIDIKK